MFQDGLAAGAVDREPQTRRKFDGPHHAHRVFAEANVRIADTPQQPLLKVFQAAHIVDHREGFDVVEKPVHCEITALGVLLRRAEGVVFGLVQAVFTLHCIGLTPEGAGFDHLASKDDVCQPETPTDQKAIAEQTADLIWPRIRSDIKILGLAAEQQVAHATANKIGDVPGFCQAIEHFQCVGINV